MSEEGVWVEGPGTSHFASFNFVVFYLLCFILLSQSLLPQVGLDFMI